MKPHRRFYAGKNHVLYIAQDFRPPQKNIDVDLTPRTPRRRPRGPFDFLHHVRPEDTCDRRLISVVSRGVDSARHGFAFGFSWEDGPPSRGSPLGRLDGRIGLKERAFMRFCVPDQGGDVVGAEESIGEDPWWREPSGVS